MLLTKHSGYFAARSNITRTTPEHRRTIFLHEELSTDHASLFVIFVEWIETGDFLSVRTPSVTVDESDPFIIDDSQERMCISSKKKFYEANFEKMRLGRLLQYWILGDYFLAGAFQNAIMNELAVFLHILDLDKRHGGMPVGKIWDDVFEQTTEHSKLRNFVADALYANMSAQTFREACVVDTFDVEELRDALLEAGLDVRQSMTGDARRGRRGWIRKSTMLRLWIGMLIMVCIERWRI